MASQAQLNHSETLLNPTVPDFVPQTINLSERVLKTPTPIVHPQEQPVIMPEQSYKNKFPLIPAVIHTQEKSSNLVNDFSKFLLKKDLLLTRLTKFSERPENYMVWKNSFKCIMSDLCVSPFEQLDLGPTSPNQVLNIRAAHASNPCLGLKMAWERLDNKFGCPEMIDESLKKKLHNFPILSKGSKKLYDLADLLSEIEALKLEPKYSSILGYYDASSGVIPIVNKLPFNLREKWVTHASNYKKHHSVVFRHFLFSAHLCVT